MGQAHLGARRLVDHGVAEGGAGAPRSARAPSRGSGRARGGSRWRAGPPRGWRSARARPTLPDCRPRTFRAGRSSVSSSRGRRRLSCPRCVRAAAPACSSPSTSGTSAERALLGRGGRAHVVVEAGDQDAALVVAQAGDELCQLHRGIGRPVAVVAAVEGSGRTVQRDLHVGHAAHAEDDLRPAGLVHRPVAEEPGVGAEARLLALEHRAQMGRARLLLALEEDLEVHREGDAGRRRARRGRASSAWIGALSSPAERA